jgi:periplasmic protein TonB
MFEASIVKATRARQGLKLRYLPLALGVHALVLTGVLVSQVWTVSAVADPPLYTTYRVALPPPSPPTGGSKPKVQPNQPTKPATAPTTPTQPETVPETPTADQPDTASSDEVADGLLPSDGEDGDGFLPGGDGPGIEPAPPEPDLTVPVELDGTMVPPVELHRVAPRYTKLAIAAHRSGVVVVQATIDRTGAVTHVRVLRPLGFGLDEAAVEAVRSWKFKPAERFGRPAAVLFNLTVKFELR